MKTCFYILIFLGLSFFSEIHAQQVSPVTSGKGYRVPVCVYEGDTIPCITLRNIYVYPKLKFKNKRQERYYYKLVNRECNQSSYQLVKAFMGPFKAGFYQAFAALFGASLKKEYHPEDDDKMVERVVTLVENGQL